MAHINGSFSSPNAGWLSVTLKGEYYSTANSGSSYWWPQANGADDCRVRASVNGFKTTALSKLTSGVSMELFYPGSNVVWPVYTEEMFYDYGGNARVGVKNLELILVLRKV